MMKKYLFLATAILALASCSSDDFIGEGGSPSTVAGQGTAISFNSYNAATTRSEYTGATAAGKLNNNFVVEGVKSDGSTTSVVYNNYNVNYVNSSENTTTSNTLGWEYVGQTVHPHATAAGIGAQTIKYWDYTATQYDFIAYSAGGATAIATGTPASGQVLISAIDASKKDGVLTSGVYTDGAYTIQGKAADLAKCYIADMVTAYNADDGYNKVVKFKFRSLSAKVRIALYETVPGYSVKNVKFYSAAETKDDTGAAHLYTTGTDVFNEDGTCIVYFPTTGYTNKGTADYNKAHLAFTAGSSGTSTVKDFGALSGSQTAANLAAAELNEAVENSYLGRSSSTAIYAGNRSENFYTVVIPNEAGAVLNLKVDYDLLSTDGSGETIHVTGATAQVPAVYAAWKSGYAYTYLFKISQNTNGQTGGTTGPAGLYPITFDAVVTETEDGVQETITTVSDPSITTYAKGSVVTANNEYKKGNNIYVVVDNGTVLTKGTNANLYTVTLESGAAQTINEASVANAIANGTYDSTAKAYKVTDANGKEMVVTESTLLSAITEIDKDDSPTGVAITINGAKFTPSAAGTYVFEYINGTNKYYKIIKVVD